MKACINCRYWFPSEAMYHVCLRGFKHDIVMGYYISIKEARTCKDNRSNFNHCGPDGIFWHSKYSEERGSI